MKPDPSSSAGENPSPQRPDSPKESRPLPGGEGDLWDFADVDDGIEPATGDLPGYVGDETAENAPAPASIPLTPRGRPRDSMPFKQTAKTAKKSAKSPGSGDDRDESAEETPPAKRSTKPAPIERKPVEDAFDDLDSEIPGAGSLSETPPEKPGKERKAKKKPAAKKNESPEKEPSAPAEEIASEKPAEDPIPTETAPETAGPAPKPASGLSKIEKISLVSFLVLFLAGGLFFIAHSINKLPEEQKTLTNSDFPIKGAKIETLRFDSYWRDPITIGANPDTVRRGTITLPVVELKVAGGPAAVRIFFRDSDGQTVGDAVTRAVKGESTLVLPATAGFDEPGMYASYRTRGTKPWTVEVFEGPSTDSPGREFKKLFEIPISTNRR